MLDEYLALGGVELGNNARAYGYSQCLSCCNGMLKCPACVGIHDATGEWTDAIWEWTETAVNRAVNPSMEAAGPAIEVRKNLATHPSFEATTAATAEVKRNLAPNPSFEKPGGAVMLRQNLVTNPSFEATTAATVEARRNYCTNPGAEVDLTGWGQVNGGASIMQRVAATPGWTPGGGIVNVAYYPAEGSVPDSGPSPGNSLGTVQPGEKITASAWVYQPTNALGGGLLVGIYGPAIGGTVRGVPTTIFGQWARISVTVTATAAGTLSMFIGTLNGIPGGGAVYYVDNVLIEKSGVLGTYFDGATTPAGDFTFAWTGAANNSASVQYGLQPPGISTASNVAPVQSSEWAASGGKSLRVIRKTPGDCFVEVNYPIVAGRTYTAMLTTRSVAPWSSAGAPSNVSSGVWVPWASFWAGGATLSGVQTWRVTFTVPSNDATGIARFILRTQDTVGGELWYDDLLLVEGVYTGGYFDGSTPPKVRRNLAYNPAAASTNNFSMAGSGNSTHTSTVDSTFSHSGGQSLKRVITSDGRTSALMRAAGAMPPGGQVSFSFWIYTTRAGKVTLYAEGEKNGAYAGAGGGAGMQPDIPANVWTKCSGTVTMPADGNLTAWRFGCYDLTVLNGDTVWFDEFIIEAGPTVGTYFDGRTAVAPYTAVWEGAADNSPSYLWDADFNYVWSGTAHASLTNQLVIPPENAGGERTLAGAFQSSHWAANRSKSIRIHPTRIYGGSSGGTNDTFADLNLPGFSLFAGKTMTIRGRVRLAAPMTGDIAGNARKFRFNIASATSPGGAEPVMTYLSTAPNTAGVHQVTATFVVPADVTTQNFTRLMNGSVADDVWWDELMLVEGVYTGPYFDGSVDPPGTDLLTSWIGTPDASPSALYGTAAPGEPIGGGVVAVSSTEWASNGSKSMRMIRVDMATQWTVPYHPMPNANGVTYTVMGTFRSDANLGNITIQVDRDASSAVVTSVDVNTGVAEWRGTYVGNGSGAPRLALYLPSTWELNESLWFDSLLITEGVYNGSYFDGTTPAKVRRNLLSNPSFEVDTGWWWDAGGMTLSRSTVKAKVGAASLLATVNVNGQYQTVKTEFPSFIGNTYSLRVSLSRGAGERTWFVQLGDRQVAVTPGDDWTDATVTWTAVATTTPIYIYVATGSAGDSVYIDAALVEVAPVAGPFFDGSTPLVGGVAGAWEGTPNSSPSYLTDPDFHYAWNGTPNASVSYQGGVRPADYSWGGAAIVQSTHWASDRSKSMRVISQWSGQGSAYVDVAGTGFERGLVAGRTYTLTVTARLDATREGIVPSVGLPAELAGYAVYVLGIDVVGEQTITMTFTVPPTGWWYLRLYNNAPAGWPDVWFDSLLISDPASTLSYFDGYSKPLGVDPALARVSWSGTPDASASLLETYTLMEPAQSLEPPYTCDAIEYAPWFDPSNPVSEQFAGSYILSVSGITDGTLTAGVTEGIEDGGVIGAGRYASRSVRVQTMLVGCGRLAAEYGLAWLKAALGTSYCARHGDGCGTADLSFFLDCPPRLDPGDPNYAATTAPYRRYLHGVACTSGPVIAQEFETTSGAYAIIVDFILTAESPFVWAETLGIANTGTTLTAYDDIPFNLMRRPSAETGDGIPQVVATQYAHNGSVEYGATGWWHYSSAAGATAGASTDIAAVGPNSFRVRLLATTAGSGDVMLAYYDVSLAGLPVGAKPSVSLWGAALAFAGTPTATLSAKVEWRTASAAISETPLGSIPMNGGNVVANGLTVPAGAVTARLLLVAENVTHAVGDDLRLYGDAFALTVP